MDEQDLQRLKNLLLRQRLEIFDRLQRLEILPATRFCKRCAQKAEK